MSIILDKVSFSYRGSLDTTGSLNAASSPNTSSSFDTAQTKAEPKPFTQNIKSTPSVDEFGLPSWGAENGQLALDKVSLHLHKGEFLGIAGHTGSGKSTLIQIMAGLITPQAGRVEICGVPVVKKKDLKKLRGRIGLVFQYPEHQLFAPTVREDIAFGPKNLGCSAQEISERVAWVLKLMDLSEDILDKSPFALSGGQQRRVALAGVLAMKPEVLILDEPFAGLDPKAQQRLSQLIEELHTVYGQTICMVSHNMNDLAKLCDRLIVLSLGTLYLEGPALEVLSQTEKLNAVGLDSPACVQLLHTLEKQGISLPLAYYETKELAALIAQAYHNHITSSAQNTQDVSGTVKTLSQSNRFATSASASSCDVPLQNTCSEA